MDEELLEMARHHAYGFLGLGPDPELAFVGVLALRELAEFCEGYQVSMAIEISPLAATGNPRVRPRDLPAGGH